MLQQTKHWDDTLCIYISDPDPDSCPDPGMAFPGAKTTVYELGLRLSCVVRNQYAERRGLVDCEMVNWVDLTSTNLDFCVHRLGKKISTAAHSWGGRRRRAFGVGRDLPVAYVARNRNVLSYARRVYAQSQADLEYRSQSFLPVCIRSLGVPDLVSNVQACTGQTLRKENRQSVRRASRIRALRLGCRSGGG